MVGIAVAVNTTTVFVKVGKRSSAGLCVAWGVSIESKGVESVVAGVRGHRWWSGWWYGWWRWRKFHLYMHSRLSPLESQKKSWREVVVAHNAQVI